MTIHLAKATRLMRLFQKTLKDQPMKSVMSIILSVILSLSAFAAPSTDIATQLYEKGDYKQAAEAFLSIAKVDGDSPELLFNLANCYAQAGDYGNAILYYSRANRLDPSNKEIKNNLNYFASKVEDSNRAELRGKKISVVPDHETFFQSVNRNICAEVAPNVWAVLAAILFILVLGAVAVYLFCSDGIRNHPSHQLFARSRRGYFSNFFLPSTDK